MKKTILVLLFCAMLVATASCNTSDDTDLESTAAITTIQPADSTSNALSTPSDTTPKDTETNNVENESPTIVETFNNILQKQYTFSQFNSIYPQYEITSKSPVAINVEIPEFEDVIFVFSGEMNGDISTFTMASVNAGGDVLLPEYFEKTFDQIKSEEPENVTFVAAHEMFHHLYQYEEIYIYRDDFYYYIRGFRHGTELTSDNIAMFLYDETHQHP